MPALFTRPCRPPNLSAAFTAVSQSLSCITSCRTNAAAFPSSDASWPALRLEYVANHDPRSFCGEQASLGCALSACSSTDEYDFPFEEIHFVLHLLEERWYCVSCDPYDGQASTIFFGSRA